VDCSYADPGEEWTDTTPLSSWSPWTLWTLPIVGSVWVRYRTVEHAHHVVVVHHQRTCEPNACPPGYVHIGDWCEITPSEDKYQHGVLPHQFYVGNHVTSGSDWTEENVDAWTEVEWQHRVFSRYGRPSQRERRSGFAPPEEPLSAGPTRLGPSLAMGSDSKGGGKDTRHGILLPALLETDQLLIGDSRGKLSVTVDGEQSAPGRALKGRALGRGLHVIDLEGEISGIGEGRLQLLLNVLSPVEIEAPPVAELRLSQESSGTVEIRLRNRARSSHGVRLQVDSMPRGWMAVSLAPPLIMLGPEEETTVPIRVGRMFITSDGSSPVTFSLRASLVGNRAPDVVRTLQVRPHDRRRRKAPALEPAVFAVPESVATPKDPRRPRASRRRKAAS
jgi:hypothetical protein